MAQRRRAYGELRDIVERHGGTMVYERAGFRYGAWVISLGAKTKTVEAMGNQAFPDLDRLYVPKPGLDHPEHWYDYQLKLVPRAEESLLALLE
jgi:hypothetical protein